MLNKPEWEFSEPPEFVDLDQLWLELRSLPAAINQYSYLNKLCKHAPLTYDLLRMKRLAEGCTIFAWPRVIPPSQNVSDLKHDVKGHWSAS